MAIPDQDLTKESYTADEVQHLLARKIAQHQITELQHNVGRLTDDVKSVFSKFEVTLESMSKTMERQHSEQYKHMDTCRDDLRSEIERDFATKTEFKVLETNVGNLATKEELNTLRSDLRVTAVKVGFLILVGTAILQFILPFLFKGLL